MSLCPRYRRVFQPSYGRVYQPSGDKGDEEQQGIKAVTKRLDFSAIANDELIVVAFECILSFAQSVSIDTAYESAQS
jgi:hypothetical protein